MTNNPPSLRYGVTRETPNHKPIMLLKVIACEVFTREVCHCVARGPHAVDLEFTAKNAHDEPHLLRALLQERIDAAHTSGRAYDAVVLCLGICGNASVGLVSRGIPLIIPRAHDCCTIFLGSKERFKEHFGDNPSTPFSSVGYLEHGGPYARTADASLLQCLGLDRSYDEYVNEYGEENARYIWDSMQPKQSAEQNRVVFIDIPEFADTPYADDCRRQAEADGKEFVMLKGSLRLIKKLIYGDWDNADIAVFPPGTSVAAVYDLDEVIRVEAPATGK